MALCYAGIVAAMAVTSPTKAPPPAFTRQLDWFTQQMGGSINDALVFGESPMGIGHGVVASRGVAAKERLFLVPGGACVSAACAVADPDIGEAARAYLVSCGFSRGGEGIVTAAMLALARYEPSSAARARFGPLADALPWGDGGDDDVDDDLAMHPILNGDAAMLGGEERLERARASARAVSEVLRGAAGGGVSVSDERCLRAITLVASRAFDLSPSFKEAAGSEGSHGTVQWATTMVPMLQNCNQPSLSGIRNAGEAAERFRHSFFSSESWKAGVHPKSGMFKLDAKWSHDAGADQPSLENLEATAPSPGGLEAGEEVLIWYDDAGWGASTAEARMEGELNFIAQYGFSPWR